MAIRSNHPIYKLLEKHLKANADKRPMTCTDLMDIDEIRTFALDSFGGPDRDVKEATGRISDILGFMWRKDVVIRYPAPRSETSFARWAYGWAKPEDEKPPKPIPPTSSMRLIGKAPVQIIETEDGVEIELDKYIIKIKQK